MTEMNEADNAKVAVLGRSVDFILEGVKDIKADIKEIKGQFLPIIEYTKDMAELKVAIAEKYVNKETYSSTETEFKSFKGIMRWLLGVVTTLLVAFIIALVTFFTNYWK